MVCNSSMVSDVREPISVHQAACACACVRVCQRKMKDKADNMRGESAHFFRWDVRVCVCVCVCVRVRAGTNRRVLSLSLSLFLSVCLQLKDGCLLMRFRCYGNPKNLS